MMYDLPTIDVPVSQGDILDGCPLFRQLAVAEVVDLDEKPARWLSRVIVLTRVERDGTSASSRLKIGVGWLWSSGASPQSVLSGGSLRSIPATPRLSLDGTLAAGEDWPRFLAQNPRLAPCGSPCPNAK